MFFNELVEKEHLSIIRKWVRGDDINDFFSYLQSSNNRKDLLFSTSYIYETARRRVRSGDADRLRRLLPDFTNKKRWILPLHFYVHWVLCVIDLEAMIIIFYDPEIGEKNRWKGLSDDISEAATIIRELLLYFNPGPWLTSMACYSTPQTDSYNCGIYVMLTGQIIHEIDGIPDFIYIDQLDQQKKRMWSEMNRSRSIWCRRSSAKQKGLTWIEINLCKRTDAVVRDPLIELCDEMSLLTIDQKIQITSRVLIAKRDYYPYGLSRNYRYFILQDEEDEENDGLWATQKIPSAENVWITSQSSIFHNFAFEIGFVAELLGKGVNSTTICLSGFFNEIKEPLGIVHSEDYHIDHPIYKGSDAQLKMLVNDVIFSFANYFPSDFLTIILAEDLQEARDKKERTSGEFLDVLITRDNEEREKEDVLVELFEKRTRVTLFDEKEETVFEKK